MSYRIIMCVVLCMCIIMCIMCIGSLCVLIISVCVYIAHIIMCAVWPWARYLTSLSFSFFVYKQGWSVNVRTYWNVLSRGPGTQGTPQKWAALSFFPVLSSPSFWQQLKPDKAVSLQSKFISVFGHLDILWAKNFSFRALMGQWTYL